MTEATTSQEPQLPSDEGQETAATSNSTKPATKTKRKQAARKLKYKVVKFHPKSQENHPDEVVLSVNGETLQIQRDVEVVLPESFLEAADHATYDKHMVGSSSRKVTGRIKLYPYDTLRDATEKEFKAQRSEGARKQAEARQREEAVQTIR